MGIQGVEEGFLVGAGGGFETLRGEKPLLELSLFAGRVGYFVECRHFDGPEEREGLDGTGDETCGIQFVWFGGVALFVTEEL